MENPFVLALVINKNIPASRVLAVFRVPLNVQIVDFPKSIPFTCICYVGVSKHISSFPK